MQNFEIVGKLGSGAYSSVFKAKRKSDGQMYALKKVKMSNLSEKEKENSLNEVRILASIDHPNIIGYKEAFFEDKTSSLCIILEFANGGDIYQKIVAHLKKGTYFSEKDIWHFFIQMVRGLKSLHDIKILHRDLKSANVFLTADDVVKLGDLNVSKMAKRGLLYTQTGTPYYASPEVWRDKPYDIKSDIWSLGCVLYEITSLKPPFRSNDMKGLASKVMKCSYPPIPGHFSSELSQMIKCLLQLSPHLRPSTEQILSSDGVQKNLGATLQGLDRQAMLLSGQDLMKTIKVPKNLDFLAHRLPKPRYHKPQTTKSEAHLDPYPSRPTVSGGRNRMDYRMDYIKDLGTIPEHVIPQSTPISREGVPNIYKGAGQQIVESPRIYKPGLYQGYRGQGNNMNNMNNINNMNNMQGNNNMQYEPPDKYRRINYNYNPSVGVGMAALPLSPRNNPSISSKKTVEKELNIAQNVRESLKLNNNNNRPENKVPDKYSKMNFYEQPVMVKPRRGEEQRPFYPLNAQGEGRGGLGNLENMKPIPLKDYAIGRRGVTPPFPIGGIGVMGGMGGMGGVGGIGNLNLEDKPAENKYSRPRKPEEGNGGGYMRKYYSNQSRLPVGLAGYGDRLGGRGLSGGGIANSQHNLYARKENEVIRPKAPPQDQKLPIFDKKLGHQNIINCKSYTKIRKEMDAMHSFPKKRHSTLSTFSPEKKFQKQTTCEIGVESQMNESPFHSSVETPITRSSAQSSERESESELRFSALVKAHISQGRSPESGEGRSGQQHRFNKLSIDTYSSSPGNNYYDIEMPNDPPSPELRIIEFLKSQNVTMSHPSMSTLVLQRKQSFTKCVNSAMGRRPSFLERRLTGGIGGGSGLDIGIGLQRADSTSPFVPSNPFFSASPPK